MGRNPLKPHGSSVYGGINSYSREFIFKIFAILLTGLVKIILYIFISSSLLSKKKIYLYFKMNNSKITVLNPNFVYYNVSKCSRHKITFLKSQAAQYNLFFAGWNISSLHIYIVLNLHLRVNDRILYIFFQSQIL
jgi:hypothetical protein